MSLREFKVILNKIGLDENGLTPERVNQCFNLSIRT